MLTPVIILNSSPATWGGVARKIVDLTQVVCASPKYLADRGRPMKPSDLARHGYIIVARAIQEGLLVPLLQDFQEPEKYPLWAILPPGRQRTPKVKVFLDFVMERFGSAPWRNKRGK
jgi:DNA-binding transcriptional LysR family regulator